MVSTPRYGGEAAAAVEGATMCWPLGKAEFFFFFCCFFFFSFFLVAKIMLPRETTDMQRFCFSLQVLHSMLHISTNATHESNFL